MKVTNAPDSWEGSYLFVYEAENVCFDGSLQKLDVTKNTKGVIIKDGVIAATDELKACCFTVTADSQNKGWYQIKSASKFYIAGTVKTNKKVNGLVSTDQEAKASDYLNRFEVDGKGVSVYSQSKDGEMVLRFNDMEGQKRFRYYKSGQKQIALYKLSSTATLTSIEVSGTPTNKTYFEGETFDPTGLVVTATYEDESTEVVTSRVEWTFNPETLTLGTNEVKATATYGEMTASKTVTVTVTEAPKVVGIDLTKDNTTTANENKLEWLGEIVTVTANKAANGTNANNYYPGTTGKEYTSTRFYKNSTLTFTPAPFVVLGEITYVATASKDETAIKYANVMENSTWTNATAKANGKIVTITPIDGTKPVSAKISDTTGGKSFSINYSLANETSLTLVAKSNDI